MGLFSNLFGDANERYVKKVQPVVEKINKLEKEFERFSDDELKAKTTEFRQRLTRG